MKKLLWVLILLLLPLTALAEDAESHRDGAFFYQIADGEATLTGCDWDAMQADSLYMFAEPPVSLEIPATLGGYPVTSIGGWVFCSLDGCPVDAPFEVVLPEGFARWTLMLSPTATTPRSHPACDAGNHPGGLFRPDFRRNRISERQSALFLRKRLSD